MFNLHCAEGSNCRVWHWNFFKQSFYRMISWHYEANFAAWNLHEFDASGARTRRRVVFSSYTMNNDLHIHRFWEKGGGDVILRILNQVIELLCEGKNTSDTNYYSAQLIFNTVFPKTCLEENLSFECSYWSLENDGQVSWNQYATRLLAVKNSSTK